MVMMVGLRQSASPVSLLTILVFATAICHLFLLYGAVCGEQSHSFSTMESHPHRRHSRGRGRNHSNIGYNRIPPSTSNQATSPNVQQMQPQAGFNLNEQNHEANVQLAQRLQLLANRILSITAADPANQAAGNTSTPQAFSPSPNNLLDQAAIARLFELEGELENILNARPSTPGGISTPSGTSMGTSSNASAGTLSPQTPPSPPHPLIPISADDFLHEFTNVESLANAFLDALRIDEVSGTIRLSSRTLAQHPATAVAMLRDMLLTTTAPRVSRAAGGSGGGDGGVNEARHNPGGLLAVATEISAKVEQLAGKRAVVLYPSIYTTLRNHLQQSREEIRREVEVAGRLLEAMSQHLREAVGRLRRVVERERRRGTRRMGRRIRGRRVGGESASIQQLPPMMSGANGSGGVDTPMTGEMEMSGNGASSMVGGEGGAMSGASISSTGSEGMSAGSLSPTMASGMQTESSLASSVPSSTSIPQTRESQPTQMPQTPKVNLALYDVWREEMPWPYVNEITYTQRLLAYFLTAVQGPGGPAVVSIDLARAVDPEGDAVENAVQRYEARNAISAMLTTLSTAGLPPLEQALQLGNYIGSKAARIERAYAQYTPMPDSWERKKRMYEMMMRSHQLLAQKLQLLEQARMAQASSSPS